MIFTETHKAALADWLATHKLTHGVGTSEAACTVAAINMAIDGRVSDECPPCMSPVLHAWIIPIQGAIPLDLLNDGRWAALIPDAADTNDGKDDLRLAIIMDHMWSVALPQLQPVADKHGFGAEWRRMCEDRIAAAKAAAEAAWAAWAAEAEAAWAAKAEAAWAAKAAKAAAEAAWAAKAAKAAEAAKAEAWAAEAAKAAKAEEIDFWTAIDPWSLLARLINPEAKK